MNNISLNSKTDGTGANRMVNVVANPSLNGPDVLGYTPVSSSTANTIQQRQTTTKLTPTTQNALAYYDKVKTCGNCSKY